MSMNAPGPGTARHAAGTLTLPMHLCEWHAELFRLIRLYAWPLLDLLIRIGLARAFFVSGMTKLEDWSPALHLAAKYPAHWMGPVAASYTGLSIEALGAALLLGLLTRPAALALPTMVRDRQSRWKPCAFSRLST